MSLRIAASFLSTAALLAACVPPREPAPVVLTMAEAPAQRIFVRGKIVTMDPALPLVDAVAIRDGLILAVGSADKVLVHRGPDTVVVDLGGKTLLPGFIDAHGHLSEAAELAGYVDLRTAPGEPLSIAAIQQALRTALAAKPMAPRQWLTAYGVDEARIADGHMPTRTDLDAVSPDAAIVVLDAWKDYASASSRALAAAKITAETPDPPGGRIDRRENGREPSGILEGTATALVTKVMPEGSEAERFAQLERATSAYAAHGVTTAQDTPLSEEAVELLDRAASAGRLKVDVVAYPSWRVADKVFATRTLDAYRNHLKLGGVTIAFDGPLETKHAWLTAPYLTPPPGRAADYRGEPLVDENEVRLFVLRYLSRQVPIVGSVNGDAAAELMLDAVAAGLQRLHMQDHRTILAHAQTLSPEQLEKMKTLNVSPSFFIPSVERWGNHLSKNVLGPERAAHVVPAHGAQVRGMRFTLEGDPPVVRPDILAFVSAAVTRRTPNGEILGPEERVDVMSALRAVTTDAAWQYFEEKKKGSITPGKLADLVVLSANPLETPPDGIKDIRVLETLKDGKTIFRAP